MKVLASKSIELHNAVSTNSFYFSGCYTQNNLARKSLNRIKAEFSNDAMIHWLQLQNGIDAIPPNFQKTMWVTFENRRPPSRGFQRSLSFDIDTLSNSNFYLPLWLTYIDLFATKSPWVRHRVTQEDLLKKRQYKMKNRQFACAFLNNPNPMRLRAIDELQKIGDVTLYGRYSNNYVADKISVSQKYKFSLCFENDLYPGYVTEKPLEAWLGGTVPLYWGDDAAKCFNPSALVNLKEFQSMQDFSEYVALLNSDESAFKKIYEQPLLSQIFKTERLTEFFSHWILE